MKKLLLLSGCAAILLSAIGVAVSKSPTDAQFSGPVLEHLFVVVRDLDATSQFFADTFGWRRIPLLYGLGADSSTYGGAKNSWIDANGIWLELSQPTLPGPNMDLAKSGADSVAEIDFEVPSFQSTFDALKRRGVVLEGYDRKPLTENGRVALYEFPPGDEAKQTIDWAALVPLAVTNNIQVEILQRGFTEDSNMRHRTTTASQMPASAPGAYLDRVTVISSNPPAAAGFFVKYMGAKAVGSGSKTRAVVETTSDGARAASIELNPITAGAARDGQVSEFDVRVEDIVRFKSVLKSKGISLVDSTGTALKEQRDYFQDAEGHRAAYLPTNVSRGLRIKVYQLQ